MELENTPDSRQHIEQILSIGRVAHSIAIKIHVLRDVIFPVSVSNSNKKTNKSRVVETESDPALDDLQSLIIKVYDQSFEIWMNFTINKFKTCFLDGLINQDWSMVVSLSELWESVSIDLDESLDKIKLPALTCRVVARSIFSMVKSLNCDFGFGLEMVCFSNLE